MSGMGATPNEFFLSIPRIGELSPRALLLFGGYYLRSQSAISFTKSELSSLLISGGVKPPPNLAQWLGDLSRGADSPLLKLDAGKYSLSIAGVQEVEKYLESSTGLRPARKSIQKLVGKIHEDAEQKFLAEVAACVEVNAKRAAVVMCWLLTVDHIQRYVLKHKLSEFNAAMKSRSGWKGLVIKVPDDFVEIKDESTFIEILRSAKIITNDVRKILDEKLGFRNTCAHPNQIEVPETKVISAIEDLVENVILHYKI